jgi:hypothetical protein
MLSEKDKQRIREEEIFRFEAQKSLTTKDSPQPLDKRLLVFFNSSLGIWLLSSVFITLIGWSYSQWQLSRENEEHVEKLDVEIQARFSAVLDRWGDRAIEEKKPPSFLAKILLLPPETERILQPEFANRNLSSLLYELSNRVDVDEYGDMLTALRNVKRFEADYLNNDLTPEKTEEFLDKVIFVYNLRWNPFVRIGKSLQQLKGYDKKIVWLILAFVVIIFSLLIYAVYQKGWLQSGFQLYRKSRQKQLNLPYK